MSAFEDDWPAVVPPGSGTAHSSGTLDTPSDLRRSTGSGGSGLAGKGEGERLLDAIEAFVARFVAFPSEAARVATVLWVMHAHAVDRFESTPRLAFLSPEPGSGKTRALEAVSELVPSPMHAVNATPAALFRAVSDLDNRPTILFDEIDTVFGPKAKDNEELRGLLNAGHRRSGVAYRCVGMGTAQKVEAFPAFCAVALAGLGDLPDTILSRAVAVRMRRRAPGETVEPFRQREAGADAEPLREWASQWTSLHTVDLEICRPQMPEGVEDRPADVWEPLLAVADVAGGQWPTRGRAACRELVKETQPADVSLGVRLLTDLRDVFRDADRMSTEAILSALQDLEEAPWSDLRGKPLDSRGLAKLINRYQVRSTKVKIDGRAVQGYRREDLHDPWLRYLPAPISRPAASPEPTEPPEPAWSEALSEVPDRYTVPEPADRQAFDDQLGATPCAVCCGPVSEIRAAYTDVCLACHETTQARRTA